MSEQQEVIENEEDEGVEVEIDAPEQDEESSGTPVSAESSSTEQDSDDELDSYSNKVQSRIKKLTEKYRKEERDREEAVRMAQQLLQENQSLKGRMESLDKGYLAEYGSRLETQVAAAKNLYREAHDNGDTDKMLEAQEALSKMSIEQERLRLAKQRSKSAAVQQEGGEVPVPQQQLQPQMQQPAPQADPKAKGWAEKNDWFGADEVMTYAAFGIHRKLVEEEGFDPQSDDYYTEVDKRMRTEFPHKFQPPKKSGGAQVAPAGASATRSTAKSGRRSVKLSPSQIAMAKRLNVPLEEYAKYVKD